MKQAIFYVQDEKAPKPNKPNHIGTCILIEHEESILLEHRRDSDTWALIGGGLKIDESLADGIIREVKEETGIVLNNEQIELFKIYDDPTRIISYPDGNILRVISVAYRCRLNLTPQLICSEESRKLLFIPRDRIFSLNIAKTQVQIIKDYLSK